MIAVITNFFSSSEYKTKTIAEYRQSQIKNANKIVSDKTLDSIFSLKDIICENLNKIECDKRLNDLENEILNFKYFGYDVDATIHELTIRNDTEFS